MATITSKKRACSFSDVETPTVKKTKNMEPEKFDNGGFDADPWFDFITDDFLNWPDESDWGAHDEMEEGKEEKEEGEEEEKKEEEEEKKEEGEEEEKKEEEEEKKKSVYVGKKFVNLVVQGRELRAAPAQALFKLCFALSARGIQLTYPRANTRGNGSPIYLAFIDGIVQTFGQNGTIKSAKLLRQWVVLFATGPSHF
ncbi:hypothetical protein niasHT_014499 [Heterodera trifolii]|uniref:Uncharacterized protein n=1 Tax=Heterodera trifolii TaxID=157864 RepID=A0ABD2KZF6_9BILA